MRAATPNSRRWIVCIGIVGCLTFVVAGGREDAEVLAPFVATPHDTVVEMLRLAEVTPGDVVYDLGSGDGRIVIAAAQRFGARGVGLEIDASLVAQSRAHAREAGVEDRVRFAQQDILKLGQELSEASVVTLFLGAEANLRMRPLLERHLRPGSRIVSYEFRMHGWQYSKRLTFHDADGRPRQIYLWKTGRDGIPTGGTPESVRRDQDCEHTLVNAESLLAGEPTSEDLAEILLLKGLCHRRLDQQAEALASLESLLLLVPDSVLAPRAAYLVGLIHQSRQDLGLARATFIELIRRFPESDEARQARTRLGSLTPRLGR